MAMEIDLPNIVMYTDGACHRNPGPGGYGVVLIGGKRRKELSGGYRRTTNSRMELRAAIAGLAALKKPSQVLLHSDSEYLVNPMRDGRARIWRTQDWRRSRS